MHRGNTFFLAIMFLADGVPYRRNYPTIVSLYCKLFVFYNIIGVVYLGYGTVHRVTPSRRHIISCLGQGI